ncbi:M23 family metallopeptidase [Synechococcus sp. R6-10]|jgi:murein DD-endopeptidase MepM/ murein hydrolase activator NlpD|uniref:M23 family metallopeptidase n=1 Tax=unclassified Synechococcus TaxID=2626047 RepID=UPI0039C4752B
MSRQRSEIKIILGLGCGICLGALSAEASTLQVQVSPPDPLLGYTVSVQITAAPETLLGDWPRVSLIHPDGTQAHYPAFQIAANRWRALIPTTPLDAPGARQIQIQGFIQDAIPPPLQLSLQPREFPVQRIRLPAGASVWATEVEWTKVEAFRQHISPEKYWQGYFHRPAQGPVTTAFGVRRYYNGQFAEDYYHRGIDYAGPVGAVVVAPAAGWVRLVGYESEGFRVHGNTIGIDHGQGVTSLLLHLSRIDVREGEWVEAGQPVGAIGATGTATGPHLHWGLFVHNHSVDPVPWLHLAIE